jgi:hypothetical protein
VRPCGRWHLGRLVLMLTAAGRRADTWADGGQPRVHSDARRSGLASWNARSGRKRGTPPGWTVAGSSRAASPYPVCSRGAVNAARAQDGQLSGAAATPFRPQSQWGLDQVVASNPVVPVHRRTGTMPCHSTPDTATRQRQPSRCSVRSPLGSSWRPAVTPAPLRSRPSRPARLLPGRRTPPVQPPRDRRRARPAPAGPCSVSSR